MTTLRLPALRGDDPLGFLAALGLSSLSEHQLLPPLLLGWEGRGAPVAVVDVDTPSLEEFGAQLETAFQSVAGRQAALPGVEPDFPVPGQGSGRDPMRMPRDEMATLFERAGRAWLTGEGPWFGRWLIALTAQATEDKKREVPLTPFYAPTGQMKLRNSLFDLTVSGVEAVQGPVDALAAWRRTRKFNGANYDDRAVRDAAVQTTGKPDNQGAPSPTWLAVMGIRYFPLTDQASGTAAVGWQEARLYPGFTKRTLVWPIWNLPLEPAAVRTMIAHPDLELTGPLEDRAPGGHRRLTALGVRAVFGASRRTTSQGDGPLGPGRSIWLAPD